MSERSAIMAELISAMAKHDNARVIEIFTSSFNGYCYFAYEVLLNASMQVLNMSMKDIDGISKQVRFMDGIMSQSGGKMSDV